MIGVKEERSRGGEEEICGVFGRGGENENRRL